MGKRLGDAEDPLLVSVRSGAPFSMPGMMDTVLNLGLNDESINGLIKQTDNPRFAWDSYRRFIQMFSNVVMGLDGDLFENAIVAMKNDRGVAVRHRSDRRGPAGARRRVQGHLRRERRRRGLSVARRGRRRGLPAGSHACSCSWPSRPSSALGTIRARSLYRQQEKIADDLGTAVNVQSMVFGNKGDTSATGVAFTRNPANGEREFYGDYLVNAQGEDVVAGIRNTSPIADLEDRRQAWKRPAPSSRRSSTCWRTTSAICATSSSPSSRASCGCCRPAPASAPPRPRCASPSRWRRKASSPRRRPSCAWPPTSSTSCCTRSSTRTPPTTWWPAA